MVVIKFNGGIGNQLFQYAFYLYCMNNGIDCAADISVYERQQIHDGFLLDQILPDNEMVLYKSDLSEYVRPFSLVEKINKKLFRHVGDYYLEQYFSDVSEVIDLLHKKKDCYLEGYWQNVRFVSPVKGQIINKKVNVVDIADEKQLVIMNLMKKTNSVSIHVRRGDYLQNQNNIDLYGNICTNDYYKSAIDFMDRHLCDPLYFVFSDDIEYCRGMFTGDNFRFVDNSGNTGAYLDILLMSECKNHIIANSSFSWWGTVFSDETGYTVMPEKWNNREKINNLIIPGSIIIDKYGNISSKEVI